MSLANAINGTYTLDETSGIQNGSDGTPTGTPRDDSDIELSTLQTNALAFYNYLFGNDSGQLQLPTTFPTNVGVAESATNIINVSDASGTVSSIGLTTATGGSFDGTQSSGVQTSEGDHTIYLVSGLNNQVVLGMYDSDGVGGLDSYAFAVYMKPDGALDSNVNVQLFTVTFTALEHTVDSNTSAAYDDAVDLLQNVYVHSTGELNISFDQMPSGANLFNNAAESASGGGIMVFGENPITDAKGKYTNQSDYISTSQGGDGATIGVNSQMFDLNEGAYFTYVNDIVDTFFSGLKRGGLSATEADLEQNMQYASLINSSGASVTISQTQGNGDSGMHIEAYLLSEAWQGAALLDNRGEGSIIECDRVIVYAADGETVLEDSDNPDAGNLIVITLNQDGSADVTGLDDGMKIEWHTVSDHNQVLIRNTAGDFDLGGFGIKEGASDTDSLAGRAWVEDDGPSIGGNDGAIPNAVVDFTTGATGTVTRSLEGAVGTDANSSPYDLTSYTTSVTINGLTLTAVPNATGSTPVTGVGYWANTNGVAGIQTSGTTPDTEFYRLTLSQTANSGAGSYTFQVLQPPPLIELQFGFADQPAGQNLFGIIATNKNDLGAGGLLFFNSGVHLNANNTGAYDNASSTVNTSKGGGEVSIGYGANNYTDPGQDAFFIFADDPASTAVGGLGLTQTTADDADTLRFNGTNAVSSASVEIVKVVSGTESGITIKAYNLDPLNTAADANPANQLLNINTDAEARDFLTNPLAFGGTSNDAVQVAINGVKVFAVTSTGSTLVYSAVDSNNDSDFGDANELLVDTNNVDVTLNGDRSITVHGMDTDKAYTVRYDTLNPHDMAQILYEDDGSYNIGGFNLIQALDTPDQKFDFTARVTDSNADFASASWSIGIDGTGVLYDNGEVAGVLIL